MNPSEQFCPNLTYCARWQIGQGDIRVQTIVHKAMAKQEKLDLVHVQVDEIWVKARGKVI